MALFWIVHKIDGQPCVRIQEGGALIFAQLNAMKDGFGGSFIEAHRLDTDTARKIPKADDRAHAHARRGGGVARPAGVTTALRGRLLPPPHPAEQTAAREDQIGEARADDRTRGRPDTNRIVRDANAICRDNVPFRQSTTAPSDEGDP